MNTKNTKAKLATKAVMKKAWAIRKLAASANGVPIKFVSLKSCILIAQGRRTGRPYDVWGCQLGGKYSKVNEAILNYECPVVIDYEVVSNLSGVSINDIKTQMSYLIKKGIVRSRNGWETIKGDRRPYWSDEQEVIYV